MPIYEYRCPCCGHELEILQSMNANQIVLCNACEGGAMDRQLSAGNFHLKGTGWYETDFKRAKK